ncbi:MAG: F0F1 ATP synthase subunit epsilon [Chloroflexi bacterium]|nr:F0F1 ATP synthase subunit epsilon [Chloroflexota bacterium]
MTIRCEIVTQERTVFSGDVDTVSLPGSEGRMGILPNHTALLTTLSFGEVIVRANDEEEFYAVGGGFAEVQPDKVIVLADSAERADEIDIERADHARERAEKAMNEGVQDQDPDSYAQIQASLMRARIRVDVGRRHSGRRRRTMAAGSGLPPEEDNR